MPEITTLDRRHFLIASGSLLLLPQLEAANKKPAPVPDRMVFLGFSYGFTETFFPDTFGTGYKMPAGMKALQKHQKDLTIVSNLWHQYSRQPHGGTVSYLTGADTLGTPGKKFHNTVSCDQVAARYLGQHTRLSSLQLSTTEKDGHGGGSSLSWNEAGKPMSGIATPFQLFESLFGAKKQTYAARMAELKRQKSVLDTYVSGIKSLSQQATRLDRERLDQYFQALREVEKRIAKEKLWADKPLPGVKYKKPSFKLGGYAEIKTMYELMVLAMQTDLTRVITYRQPLEKLLGDLNVVYSGHQLSHYHGSIPRREAAEYREEKQTQLFADFIDQLKRTRETDGSSIFDHCVVSYGSNIRTGHMLKNVPAFITGNINHKFKHGRHIKMPKDTALCNLWLSLLKSFDLPVDTFGDSTGEIKELFAV